MRPDQPTEPGIPRLARHLKGDRLVPVSMAVAVLATMWIERAAQTGLGAVTEADLAAVLEEGRARRLKPERAVDLLERRLRLRRPRYRYMALSGGLTALAADPRGLLRNIPDRKLPPEFRSKAAAGARTFIRSDVAWREGLGFSRTRLAVCWGLSRGSLYALLDDPRPVRQPARAPDSSASKPSPITGRRTFVPLSFQRGPVGNPRAADRTT